MSRWRLEKVVQGKALRLLLRRVLERWRLAAGCMTAAISVFVIHL